MFFRWHDLIYIEKQTSHRYGCLLKPVNKFSKVAGYKLNVQNSIASLEANSELHETETQKAILLIITTNNKIHRQKINQSSEESEQWVSLKIDKS